MLFGAIADDYTGATDVAGALAGHGARVIQVLGRRPDSEVADLARGYDAVVVALKSRAQPAAEACAESLAVMRQLRALGARQVYFKYCSTFDSTKEGNIGPVTDALMTELDVRFTVAVPAFPAAGRTQYLGHLFVGMELLSESPLSHHPLNPMTDANLVRHLQAQTSRRVGLLPHPVVREGSRRVSEEIRALQGRGVEIALIDALNDADLDVIAEALVTGPLITGGSGLPARLAALWARKHWVKGPVMTPAGARAGATLIVAGSCSTRTLDQIRHFTQRGRFALPVDVRALLLGDRATELERLERAARDALDRGPVLVYSSAPAETRDPILNEAAGRGISPNEARRVIEETAAALVRRLLEQGVRNLVVAGGETSGAVVEAIELPALEIGALIDPGVPLCRALGGRRLHLVLKSGNFGSVDFFEKCVNVLGGGCG